jgi:uncharacterized protein
VRLSSATEPTRSSERITTLDAIRGIAVLGILPMNVVSYALIVPAYFNLAAGGSETWFDWLVGAVGEIFFDQKFMGLFSLLFGAGVVLFADRAAQKGRHPGWFSMWRMLILFGIGAVHTLIWDGDVLVVYALCAPIVILTRNARPRTLLVAGTTIALSSALLAVAVQQTVDPSGAGLGEYWLAEGSTSDTVGLWLIADFFLRALGMMLIGVALYRIGVLTGKRDDADYRRLVRWGLSVGVPLSALGLAIVARNDFSPEVAVIGSVPNTLATIPIVLGYIGLIVLWTRRPATTLHSRINAVGRMALTNYLMQTILGVIVLRGFFDGEQLTRGWLLLFVVIVWALQLWWSQAWFTRFRYGPAEWIWRCATYRKSQPIRLEPTRHGANG